MKILLIGQMGSGKDEAAKHLIAKYNLYPEKLGLHIRKHIDEMLFDITTDQRRSFYQAYGEGMRDIFGQYFWCERLSARLKSNAGVLLYHKGIIITDCRQDHELEYFMKQDYVLVAVDADTSVRIDRLTKRDGDKFDAESFTHPTEERASRIIDRIKRGGLNGYVVDNSGDRQSLYEQLDKVAEQIQCSGVTV